MPRLDPQDCQRRLLVQAADSLRKRARKRRPQNLPHPLYSVVVCVPVVPKDLTKRRWTVTLRP